MRRCFAGSCPLRFPLIAGALQRVLQRVLQTHCSQNPIWLHCRRYCRRIAEGIADPLQQLGRPCNTLSVTAIPLRGSKRRDS
jgi:hypothetical protein